MRLKSLCSVAALLLAPHLLFGQSTVDGTVVNSQTGAPMASVRVKLTGGRSGDLYAVSDARGQFHFAAPSAGALSIVVERPGLTPVTTRVGLDADGAGPATVTIPVTPGGIVTGLVTDPNGFPAETGQVRVEIYQRQQILRGGGRTSRIVSLTVDDRGEYRSAPLEPGTYYVGAPEEEGFADHAWHATYYPHTLNLDSAAAIELTPGRNSARTSNSYAAPVSI